MRYFAPTKFTEYRTLKRLYKSAFPRCERKPFSMIKKMHKVGASDIWYFEEDGEFLGLATTVNGDSFVLIDYFAVNGEKRGQGYGTQMLKSLIDYYKPGGVFLEIEKPYQNHPDVEIRIKRKRFYLNAGLSELGTSVRLFGVDMELLGTGVTLSFDEYREFYIEKLSKFGPRALFEKNVLRID